MTLPTIDLTTTLDELEAGLAPLPAKSVALGRATVRRTNDIVVSMVSGAARRADRVATTARVGFEITRGQARAASDRVARDVRTGFNETVGQARAQAARTAGAAETAAESLLDDATASVDPDRPPRGIRYERWTRSELYERAQALEIGGRSSMTKQQLVEALRGA